MHCQVIQSVVVLADLANAVGLVLGSNAGVSLIEYIMFSF